MKKHRKPKRPARRTVLFTVWLPRDEKERLEQISLKTGLDQSKLARKALALLYEAYNRGQLELGFPEPKPEIRIAAQ